MKGYGGASRRALFERFDRPALQPLPRDRYVHADWRHARVNIDYHVEVDRHYYSVPHALIHAAVEICLTATTVDVLLRGVRVWLHVRSYQPGRHTTIPEHMPKAHRAHLEWSPSRLIGWGATIGPPHRGAGPGAAREPAASRARLSLVPGHSAAGEAARPGAARRRLRPCARRRRAVVSPRRVDPQTRPGPSAPGRRARAAERAARACQRPRPRVLRTA